VHDNIVGGIETHGVFSSTATTWANSNLTLSYDTAYNNPGYAKSSNHTGDGIVLSDVTNALIDHCVAYANGTQNTHVGGPVGIWAWDSDHLTIQYSTSHNNHTNSTADGGGFDLDGGCTYCTLQYNYSYNNDGAGYGLFEFSGARAWNHNTVAFNISENDGRKNGYGAITLWNGGSGVNNAQVYNNTIYLTPTSAGARGIYVENTVSNVGFYDNIIQSTGGATLVDVEGRQSSLSFLGNDYWSTGSAFSIKQFAKKYTSLSSWEKATGSETLNGKAVGANVAPGFAGTPGTASDGAYKLASGSALNGAGLALSQFGVTPPPLDYFGDPVGSPWNVGAD
ncbi:MAG TPA: hypothetical protein VLJ39_13355, partial [Tepidisphaeraceae bacterium]|nr:hypothetical protein [Tepidisphaeraceae bacterium]